MINYGSITFKTLYDSIANNDVHAVHTMFKVNPSLIHYTQDYWLDTPLHTVVRFDAIDVLKFLLTCPGVDVNARNLWGETPLILCGRFKRVQMVEMLLESGRVDVNAQDIAGNSMLHTVSTGDAGIYNTDKEQRVADRVTVYYHTIGQLSDQELQSAMMKPQIKRELAARYAAEKAQRVAYQEELPTHISPKSQIITLLLCLFLGTWGFHRFYVGRIKGGFLFVGLYIASMVALLSAASNEILGVIFGLPVLILWVIDLSAIFLKKFKDAQGRWVEQ